MKNTSKKNTSKKKEFNNRINDKFKQACKEFEEMTEEAEELFDNWKEKLKSGEKSNAG